MNRSTNLTFVVFLIFLILKLTGNISWSWWWVSSPLWITAGFFMIALMLLIFWATALIAKGLSEEEVKRRLDSFVVKFIKKKDKDVRD